MQKPITTPDGEVGQFDPDFFVSAKRGRPALLDALRKRGVNLTLAPDVAGPLHNIDNSSAFVIGILRE